NRWPMAVEAIRLLKPDFYVKGPDYRDMDSDRTGGIKAEAEAVAQVGGRLVFTNDITFSSSSIINRYTDVFPPETRRFLEEFGKRYGAEGILKYVFGARSLKVLAVGETIIDEYQYCDAIGKSSKEPTLAVRLNSVDRFAGGILAVARHLRGFCGKVGLVSALGDPGPLDDFVQSHVGQGVTSVFIRRSGTPTIVKRRLVERYYSYKLVEIYEMDDRGLTPDEERELCGSLEELLPEHDAVIVVDFGHGMLGAKAIDLICEKSRFLAVNAQANAGNLAFHAISKYPRADHVSLTEMEMRLDARDRSVGLEHLTTRLASRMGARTVTVTQGTRGALCYDEEKGFVQVPAVATRVVDRVGAGDAFLSLGALCAAQGAPADIVGFVGAAAAAQAVAAMGNKEAVDPLILERHIESLLK
ncbi:MAG: cytidyltransferase, partial [Gemmatimonadetes bacterium]|nr:cytidyltransferase [Gemmatimonadota bacterium]